ncbi:hypothetical protein GF354_01830 [Candidatus Peregrinibacteria bacterium]|nr:hypothetical protein [Candidatus Peregrinibacteria bacterium]
MKRKLLSIFISFFAILFLSSCIGGEEISTDDDSTIGKYNYETANFSIHIPPDWEIIENNKFTSSVPDDIVVVFRNNIKNEIFTANASVGVNILSAPLTSSDLGKSTLAKARTRLIDYREIKNEQRNVNYGEESLLGYYAMYEGKRSADSPITVFKQLFAVRGEIGYIVTAAYLPTEDETVVNYIDDLLESFSLK